MEEKEKKDDKDKGKAAGRQLPQKVKNYLVYSSAAVLALIVLLALFGGDDKAVKDGEAGADLTLPDPHHEELVHKKDFYEDMAMTRQAYGPDLDDLFEAAVGESGAVGGLDAVTEPAAKGQTDPYDDMATALAESSRTLAAFENDLNEKHTGGAEIPEEKQEAASAREASLQAEVNLLQRQLDLQKETSATLESLLMQTGQPSPTVEEEKARHEARVAKEAADAERAQVYPVAESGDEGVVSSLSIHTGFYGMGNSASAIRKNTIRATIYGRQVVLSGQQVRLRLEEPMLVGSQILPTGAIVSGIATVGIDRLYITITAVAHEQVITNISLEAYDLDGQQGLFVPGSMESEALRDLGKELTNSIANTTEQSVTSLVNTTKASEQLKTDLARGALQGTARFINKKLDQVKITVQDGHKVLLRPNNI